VYANCRARRGARRNVWSSLFTNFYAWEEEGGYKCEKKFKRLPDSTFKAEV
jgi:hypothetical protein